MLERLQREAARIKAEEEKLKREEERVKRKAERIARRKEDGEDDAATSSSETEESEAELDAIPPPPTLILIDSPQSPRSPRGAGAAGSAPEAGLSLSEMIAQRLGTLKATEVQERRVVEDEAVSVIRTIMAQRRVDMEGSDVSSEDSTSDDWSE